MKIQEYADVINANMILIYYSNQNRWTAKFKNGETKEDKGSACLLSEYGNGETPAQAIGEYVRSIRGKILVLDAARNHRREFVVPKSLEP